MKKVFLLVTVALALAVGLVHAQNASSTSTKKELIGKLLTLQQPAIENIARSLAEQPAAVLQQQANMVLQTRVPPDKREAIANGIQGDLKKYIDDAVPYLRDQAVKMGPATIGTMLDEKFTEDELKQLLAIIESPVNRKFQQLGGDLQKSLADKLIADSRGQIEPKVKVLEQSIANRLMIPQQPVAASSKAKPPAKAASK